MNLIVNRFFETIYAGIIFLILFAICGRLFAQTATVALPSGIQGVPLTTIDIPITVTTSSDIGLAQFIVEYNSTILTFTGVQSGSDVEGFTVSLINPDLPFPPSTPGTDDNVLVQISGGGANSFTGDSKEAVVLKFDVIGSPGDSSPLAFDQGTNRTFLTTIDLQEINGSDITFMDSNLPVVPVELISFAATVKDNMVELQWSTVSESNNYGFDVERSEDGLNFILVGFVAGHSTTLIPHNYCFVDKNLAFGTYYYRLKQIDFNGTFEYSSVIEASIQAPGEIKLSQNYPNPFNPETMIEYHLPRDTYVVLRIYNLTGQQIRRLVAEHKKAGYHQESWNGKDNFGIEVSSGSYLYTIEFGDIHLARKMVKMR